MAYSKSDISRIDKQRRAVPDKIYIENPDVYGRTQYYIGTNQFTLTPITQAVYNTLVGNNQVQATTSVTETDPVFTAWLAGPPNISIFNNDSGYLITVAVDGVTITGDGTPGNPLVAIAGGASPLTTKGDLYTFSTVDARLAVGATNGMFLQVASGATTGNQWSPYTLPVAVPTVGKILRSDGTNMLGTTATYPDTVTSGRLIMASASNVVSDVAMSGDATITNAGVITVTSLANLKKGSFGATWNGQGGVIANSNSAIVEITMPYAGTISDWNVESYYTVAGLPTALAGTILFDIYRSGASIIGAGNKPTLTAASTASAAVAGWTSTAVAAGDKLFIYIVGTPVTSLVVSVTINITKT